MFTVLLVILYNDNLVFFLYLCICQQYVLGISSSIAYTCMLGKGLDSFSMSMKSDLRNVLIYFVHIKNANFHNYPQVQ